MTYSEGSTTIHKTSVCHRHRDTISASHMSKDGSFRNVFERHRMRGRFERIQSSILDPFVSTIGILPVLFLFLVSTDVLELVGLLGRSAESTLVVNAPRENFVVVSERSRVHASDGDLDNTDGLWLKVWIQTRALHVGNLALLRVHVTEAEFSVGSFAEHVDVELVGRRVIDGREFSLRRLWRRCRLFRGFIASATSSLLRASSSLDRAALRSSRLLRLAARRLSCRLSLGSRSFTLTRRVRRGGRNGDYLELACCKTTWIEKKTNRWRRASRSDPRSSLRSMTRCRRACDSWSHGRFREVSKRTEGKRKKSQLHSSRKASNLRHINRSMEWEQCDWRDATCRMPKLSACIEEKREQHDGKSAYDRAGVSAWELGCGSFANLGSWPSLDWDLAALAKCQATELWGAGELRQTNTE